MPIVLFTLSFLFVCVIKGIAIFHPILFSKIGIFIVLNDYTVLPSCHGRAKTNWEDFVVQEYW